MNNNLKSGRFWLTITAAISFIILVITMAVILVSNNKKVNIEHVILLITNLSLVIQNVFNSYFNKKRDD
jgi:hypothetical protein